MDAIKPPCHFCGQTDTIISRRNNQVRRWWGENTGIERYPRNPCEQLHVKVKVDDNARGFSKKAFTVLFLRSFSVATPTPSCPYFGESLRWDATGVEDNKFTKERILSFILGFTRIYFKWLRVSFKFERSCKTQEWHLRALKLCILGG